MTTVYPRFVSIYPQGLSNRHWAALLFAEPVPFFFLQTSLVLCTKFDTINPLPFESMVNRFF